MGTHIQRKRFDHPQLAAEARQGFRDHNPSIPGARVVADVREIDGQIWLYVTTEGKLITGLEPVLPEYEHVSG